MTESKKPGLRMTSMILLMGIFALGGMSGAFLYATGEQVVTDTWMQMISHTEYRYGETGQVIARLVDYQGNPVVVNNCTATILYPDKSFFVQDDLMSESVNISGDHYYTFTTPQGPEGVYEYQATCFYDVGATTRNKSVTNSFHLSSAFNTLQDTADIIREDALVSDGFEDGDLVEYTLYGSPLITSTDGFSNSYGVYLNGSGEAFEVNVSPLRTDTSVDTLDGVTAEVMLYFTPGDGGHDIFYDWNQYLLYTEVNSDGTVSLFEDDRGLQIRTDEVLDEGWHVMQVYTYSTAPDVYSAELWIDDVFKGVIEDINWTAVGAPTLVGVRGAGGVGDLFDNFQVYEGSPEDSGIRFVQIQDQINATASIIISNLDALNVSLTGDFASLEARLDEINTTTTNTYQYLTGTLTNSVDQILTDLGVINETVNRIETNTVAINDTVNQILQNQQDEVFMTVFSG